MKLPSPLTLLTLVFYLHLLTATPIPSEYRNILSTDYLYYTCQPSQRITFTSKPNTPQKTLSTPHFSSRQLFSFFSSSAFAHRAAEQTFNNAPLTPPKQLERSQALSARVPLQSSYLLSLANTATILEHQDRFPKALSVTDDLAAKPTSALPYLREEDAKRYWATLHPGPSSGENGEHGEIVAGDRLVVVGSTRVCADGFPIKEFYSREPTRGYDDILVVGILVLFLVAVAAWEAAEIIGDMLVPLSLRLLFIQNRVDNMWLIRFMAYGRRRLCGKVCSEDGETVVSIKKAFFLYRVRASIWDRGW